MEEFRVIETIGHGKFDLRQKVTRVSDRRLFEWREINYKSMDDALKEVCLILCWLFFFACNISLPFFLQMFIFEINSLKKLRHPNIIHHEDVILKRDQFFLYLITECCGDSSLQTLIDQYQMYVIIKNLMHCF
jgi:serine/threonine protein kinase